MVAHGFLWCKICAKKVQPIDIHDVIKTTVFCKPCKTYFKVLIAYGKLYEMQKVEGGKE